jgi:hypothetical protein
MAAVNRTYKALGRKALVSLNLNWVEIELIYYPTDFFHPKRQKNNSKSIFY